MKYKVLLTTSGVGSRLGDVTKYTNKSLVPIGKRPAISHIIEAYPKETKFIITLGYYGNHVRDFLKLAYPSYDFTFVKVDNYQGKGSSLAYSMLKASRYLRSPFIFHACDTLIKEPIPLPDYDWSGGHKGPGSSQYTSFSTIGGYVKEIFSKGMIKPEFLHIGLIGIANHRRFWLQMRKLIKKRPYDSTLGDVSTLRTLIKRGVRFKALEFRSWLDIGNTQALEETRKKIKSEFHVMEKPTEAIFFFDDFVIKFFHDENIVKKRVKRSSILVGKVPPILDTKPNFYKYKFVPGILLSDTNNTREFRKFLKWLKSDLWKPANKLSQTKFNKVCYDFYITKTKERINTFLETRATKDGTHIINGITVPPVSKLLAKIDHDWLCSSKQSHFHGDLIPDNILKTRDGYCLIDFRQDFGGQLVVGDKYYDIAKFNQNLIVNHELIRNNLFSIQIEGAKVTWKLLRKQTLVEYERIMRDFLLKNNYDLKKVEVLTAIIRLNMSPLHHHLFDEFLFYFGKYNLYQALYGNQ